MVRFVEGEYEKRHVAEEQRLNKIHEESVKIFGPKVGSAFFKYAYGSDIYSNRPSFENEKERDWSGKRVEFAQAVVETMEIGTTEEKVQALTALLKSFEVQIGIETRERPPVIF